MISPLIVPMAFEGLVCVDHADVKSAIEHGGDMQHFERRSQNFLHAITAMIGDARDHLASLGANAAVCGGLEVPSTLTMVEFDVYLKKIYEAVHPDIFAVISWVIHDDPETIASILTISG